MKHLRILVSGSSGLVGKALCQKLLDEGHQVIRLSRRSLDKDTIFWDPQNKSIDRSLLEGFDACIHLAGESLASGFWTRKKKEEIVKSRVDATSFLVDSLLHVKAPPNVFISASAVGFYGSSQAPFDETAVKGKGFLSDVCEAWEAASKPLILKGIRVVHARLGVVLAKKGGFLKALNPLFSLGLGAYMGTGEQKLAWITLEDAVRAFLFTLHQTSLQGPVNFVAPEVVSQKNFSFGFAKALHKPCFFRIPQALFPGEKAQELIFSSHNVIPSSLLKAGFTFSCRTLKQAWDQIFASIS